MSVNLQSKPSVACYEVVPLASSIKDWNNNFTKVMSVYFISFKSECVCLIPKCANPQPI